MKRLTLLLVTCFCLTTLFSNNLTRKPEMSGSLKVRDVSVNYLDKHTDSKLTTVSTNSMHSKDTEIQVKNTYDLYKNSLLARGVIIDTLVSSIIGSTVPAQDPNGGDVINGGFTIEKSGNDPVTGNGIDEITRWNFTYANLNIDSSSQVISAQLTLIIEQKDAGASNDFVKGDNCGCTSIFVGLYPLNGIETIQFEMLNLGYDSQLFIDHIITDGFPMFYQDDAIVSIAELKLIISNQVTGIGDDQGSLITPISYNLAQNFPNPFNPSTKISWQSPVGSHQTLKIYDILGNEVATLVDEFREAGSYEIEFNASQLSSGIYFYKLQIGSFVETKKMILLR